MVHSPDDGVILVEKFISNNEHEIFCNLFELGKSSCYCIS